MNAAGTQAPEAAGADGTRLAPGRSSRLGWRGRPEESQAAAAPLEADEWPAAGAPPRFPPAPPPRPLPATTSGPASGWLRRRLWAPLLVLGLLVAGAADGCELVPRHLPGRRAAGSAAAAASPAAAAAAAAGDSSVLMTGEGLEGGGRRAGLCRTLRDHHLQEGPAPLPTPALRRPGSVRDARTPAPWSLLGRRLLHSGCLPSPPNTPPSPEPPDGIRFPALKSAPRCSTLSNAVVSLPCCRKSRQGLQGTGLIFFFFFLKLLEVVSSSNAVWSPPLVLLLQRQLAASLTGSKPR